MNLFGFIPEFKDSWIFYLLIVIIPYIIFFSISKKRKGSLKFSSVRKLKKIKQGWRYRLRHIPAVLRIIAVILLIFAAARPRKGITVKTHLTKGIAIQMVIDKSGSMKQLMNFKNKQMTRLDVVKEVFAQFVSGKLASGKRRQNDLIGITSFSGAVEFNCPLTLEHSNFDNFLKSIEVYDYEKYYNAMGASMSQEELNQFRQYAQISQMTAIGDALYYTALKMIEADKYYKNNKSSDYKIKSKVIILLTDGQNTYGNLQPAAGSELAAANGIKVYTIGIGSKRGGQYIDDPIFGRMFVGMQGDEVDAATLKNISSMTGGKFYLAEDGESLQKIYKEIDSLEKTEIEDSAYLEYNELFRKFLLPGLLVLLLEIILSTTIFRRIP
ncbi:MAG TPA: VWA domain-containing protein [bacterium]|nr:VWA domain-containing protein [bacterium]HPN29391.1 VWA domain-containing protein [bacterium]